jgi:hypothetical protein
MNVPAKDYWKNYYAEKSKRKILKKSIKKRIKKLNAQQLQRSQIEKTHPFLKEEFF